MGHTSQMSHPQNSDETTERPTDRVLLRAAYGIRQQLLVLRLTRADAVARSAGLLAPFLAELDALRRKLHVARSRGWQAAAGRILEGITRVAYDVQYHNSNLQQAADTRRATVPSVRELLAELRQLQDEFPCVGYGNQAGERALTVEIEPVELEGVYLGPFRIRLDISRLGEGQANSVFRVLALDPQAAASNDMVTHPHVSDERLCMGDATNPIRQALADGRICDFFLLVRGVLTTYNPSSPYVSLDNWSGTPCHDCGRTIGEDDCHWCSSCEHEFCDDCSSYCQICNDTACAGCLTRCPVCEESVCPSCITRCPDCGQTICKTCLEEHACSCHEDEEESQNGQTEEPAQVAAVGFAEAAA
jgi:hypothetical protein